VGRTSQLALSLSDPRVRDAAIELAETELLALAAFETGAADPTWRSQQSAGVLGRVDAVVERNRRNVSKLSKIVARLRAHQQTETPPG
jgi:hypothetical protein